ncbi:hypothetical protein [Herbidospora daliensis]|uniref:hypothetical protein n=1 Tax=Herbidospora daliensis TaxID=295585 RepID=UPI0007802784|nr:hypothetical protein [Herbidospora daliensis]
MNDDYRKRVAEAIGRNMILRTSPDEIAGAVLAVRDEEIEALKAAVSSTAADALTHGGCGMRQEALLRRAEKAEAENQRLRTALHNLNAEWTHRATNMAAASGAAPDIECARMLAGADELDRARFAISKVLNSGPAEAEGRQA